MAGEAAISAAALDRAALSHRQDRAGNLDCPHCESPGRVRSSDAVTPQHRKIYYFCSNVFCGHTWLATVSYEYGLSPSSMPNPRVTLPLRPMDRQKVMELLRQRDADQPELFDLPASAFPAPDTG
ncbi:MAG: ogr/Delta-like zinc finger family protein [Novosphingobium sp.]